MELGALICTPKAPMCMFCPVQQHCRAFAEGIQLELPVKKKAKKQKSLPYLALLIKNKDDQYVIEKRPDKGLLANLWQFIIVQANELHIHLVVDWLKKDNGLTIS